MPNVYQPGLLQIRPQYQFDPDAANTPENVLWFQSAQTTTPTLAQMQTIQHIFDTNWGAVWAPYGVSTHSYQGSVITDWSSNVGLSFSTVGSFTPVTGTAGGVAAAPQVAALISYHIAKRYKGGHPRTYLPLISQGVIGGTANDTIVSSVTQGAVTNINTLIGAMKSSNTLGGQTMVVYLGKTNPAKAQVWQFSTFTAQSLIATQRRRVRHVGRK